ncbi:Apolipoprotein(a) [Seminavis robusta]|uniref:Apolipoprotein(A) n=1 Tax=Seminavis robusta TaxID=568900 RepID=A0A9N8EEL3_9STRA|nr:Apolipoprotein(a) [Seminavis robusta]|eukprot:Sro887_g216290.1 Apolipoprotein(a) (1920) ;mRNA; f:15226-22315
MKLGLALCVVAVPFLPGSHGETVRAAISSGNASSAALRTPIVLSKDAVGWDTNGGDMLGLRGPGSKPNLPIIELYPEDARDRSYNGTRNLCAMQGKKLCTFERFCTAVGDKIQGVGDAMNPHDGDQWIAYELETGVSACGDGGHWLQIAENNETWKDCLDVKCPPWGKDPSSRDRFHKYIACCEMEEAYKQDEQEAMLQEIQRKVSLLKTIDFTNLSLRDRIKQVESASGTLREVRQGLESFDVGENEFFRAARASLIEHADTGLNGMSKVIEMMESAAEDETRADEIPAGTYSGRKLAQAEQNEGKAEANARYKSSSAKKHRAYFSRDPMALNIHSKLSKVTNSVMDGSMDDIERVLLHGYSEYSIDASGHGRRMKDATDPWQRAKGKQCRILAGCAKTMSLYDVFVSFYADDIDTTAGTVDTNIVKFDERDLIAKHKNITGAAKSILPGQKSDYELGLTPSCDELLKYFHRTVEQGDLPKWEGATVSEVCLAEGTPKYIGFGQIAQAVGSRIATILAEEQLNCAWDLHNSKARKEDPRFKHEPFVFADSRQYPDPNTRLTITDLLIPTGLSQNARDIHGKVQSEQDRSPYDRYFDYQAYHAIDLRHVKEKDKSKKLKEHFHQVQLGFGFVFGEKQSTGFVCGIKDAVLNHDKSMPGHCCLDAPYENEGDDWGRKFDCKHECKHPGPFFAGMSTEACASHGGTWCAAPTNCWDLKVCVESEIKLGKEKGHHAYAKYVEGGRITDPKDVLDCGRARKYFGYDEHYTHDDDVCENVRQLRNTRRFKDLDRFFGRGADGSSGKAEGPKEVDSAKVGKRTFFGELVKPKREQSGTNPVQSNQAWAAVNFVLELLVDSVWSIFSTVAGLDCPSDPTFVSYLACLGVKNGIIVLVAALYTIAKFGLAISEFARDQYCTRGANEEYRTYENTEAIYANTDTTFRFLDHIYGSLVDNQDASVKSLEKRLEQLTEMANQQRETLGYLVDKIDSMDAPKVTHRPTEQPTRHPTSAPTSKADLTRPTPRPTIAPTTEDFCEPLIELEDITATDWYLDRFGCDGANPCHARVDLLGRLWVGAKGSERGPGSSFGTTDYFFTNSKTDTRKMICGQVSYGKLVDVEVMTIWSDGSSNGGNAGIGVANYKVQPAIEFLFKRCTPKFSVEDIQQFDWVDKAGDAGEFKCPSNKPYCLKTTVDSQGKLWMGVEGVHSGVGPNLQYGQGSHWHTTSRSETLKLMCGQPAKVEAHHSGACGCSERGQADYLGSTSKTSSGKTCQPWSQQWPQKHNHSPNDRNMLPGTNVCRNPDKHSHAWCYTADPKVRWESCQVPTCSSNMCQKHTTVQMISKDSLKHSQFFTLNRVCTPLYTEGLLVGSKWLNKEWGCTWDKPCVAVLDSHPKQFNRLWMGKAGDSHGPPDARIFDAHKFFRTDSAEATRKLMCGEAVTTTTLGTEPRFIVVHNGQVTNSYPDGHLDDAKKELARVAQLGGSRLIAEVVKTVVQQDPHHIDGNAQTKANGFDNFWHHWDDIKAMIAKAQEYNDQMRKVKIEDGGNKVTLGSIAFTRICEPIYNVDDITELEWHYSPWGKEPVVAKIDFDGLLWVGVVGDGWGPYNTYGALKAWRTKSRLDTRKLLCGELADVLVSETTGDKSIPRFSIPEQVTMVNGNTILHSSSHKKFSRTNVQVHPPKLKMFGLPETNGVQNYFQALGFCKARGLDLGSKDDYCTDGKVFSGTKQNDQWAPISDEDMGYIQVGTGKKTCSTHKEVHGYNPDGKGNGKGEFATSHWATVRDYTQSNFEHYILCKQSNLHLYGPSEGTKDVKNYTDSVEFCQKKEMVLGSYRDYCPGGWLNGRWNGGEVDGWGHPIGDYHQDDQWAPISDTFNDWVFIGRYEGLNPETCGGTHLQRHGSTPAWGNDGDTKSSFEANFILCRKKKT